MNDKSRQNKSKKLTQAKDQPDNFHQPALEAEPKSDRPARKSAPVAAKVADKAPREKSARVRTRTKRITE